MHTDPPVLTETLPTANGRRIGLITLNNEKSLNAQNTEMIGIIAPTLAAWAQDDGIALAVLRGAGEKAFCAGGDIRSAYHALTADDTFPNPAAQALFSAEYALCRQIHRYPKPVLVWANGIVMGGGMGLAAAASHRIVTDTTVMAMPEISIGLFPDAGGSWFLQRMPARSGLFCGLTGARLNAADALLSNLAECLLPSDYWPQLTDNLTQTDWQSCPQQNRAALSTLLNRISLRHDPSASQLLANFDDIRRIVCSGSLNEADRILRETEYRNPWLAQAADNYRCGCPATAALVWHLFHHVRNLSLDDIFRLELNTVMHCCRNGEFREGVRALLIDKDKNPRWRQTLSEITAADTAAHFDSPFPPGCHPFDHWTADTVR